jgi:hypothetical protein
MRPSQGAHEYCCKKRPEDFEGYHDGRSPVPPEGVVHVDWINIITLGDRRISMVAKGPFLKNAPMISARRISAGAVW